MLYHYDGHRKIKRQRRKQGCQRIRSARGTPDRQNIDARTLPPRCRHNPSRFRRWYKHHGRKPDSGLWAQRDYLRNELLPNLSLRHIQAARVARFGKVVAGPELQRVQRDRCTTLGQRAEHDHGESWVESPYFLHRLQARQARHLHIQSNKIRFQLRNLRQPDLSTRSSTRNLYRGVRAEHVAQHPTNHHRVIDDENSYRRHTLDSFTSQTTCVFNSTASLSLALAAVKLQV